MITVTILHPFTPEVVGLSEKKVLNFHSQPHFKALDELSKNFPQIEVSMLYFTSKFWPYKLQQNFVKYHFFPVQLKLKGDHKKWRKQYSLACEKYFDNNCPDLTIVNMSAHSSPFCQNLAKLILSKGKIYIPMLGGQHYSESSANNEYYQNAHHILVHTLRQKSLMQKMNMFKGKRIEIFPLGVDTVQFKACGKSSNTFPPNLLYVGRILEWKRIHLALSVVKFLKNNDFPQVLLKIIGPVSSINYYNQLLEIVAKDKLQTNVAFVGEINYDRLPLFYHQADILLLPSERETFGMVMIEAMSCATPVAAIISEGGPMEVIKNMENGILCEVSDYARTIHALMNDKTALETMGNAARKTIVEKYSQFATYKALLSSVQSVIDFE